MTEAAMTKDEFRRYVLSAEKEELKRMTPEEAFEAGRRGDLSQYDLAGRKVACALLGFFERHPEVDPQRTYYMAEGPGMIQIDTILDERANREIDAIDPSGAMFGWALTSVKWLLEKPG